MPLPPFDVRGLLPPGIHEATLEECLARFAAGSEQREQYRPLLIAIVEAALLYPAIKRVLLWGSFVRAVETPNDLDYSVVISINYDDAFIAPEHRRFLTPYQARLFYGADRGYLQIPDYPLEQYIELVDFLCETRNGDECGIVEIPLRGVTG